MVNQSSNNNVTNGCGLCEIPKTHQVKLGLNHFLFFYFQALFTNRSIQLLARKSITVSGHDGEKKVRTKKTSLLFFRLCGYKTISSSAAQWKWKGKKRKKPTAETLSWNNQQEQHYHLGANHWAVILYSPLKFITAQDRIILRANLSGKSSEDLLGS